MTQLSIANRQSTARTKKFISKTMKLEDSSARRERHRVGNAELTKLIVGIIFRQHTNTHALISPNNSLSSLAQHAKLWPLVCFVTTP
jgi:hypothetical protein